MARMFEAVDTHPVRPRFNPEAMRLLLPGVGVGVALSAAGRGGIPAASESGWQRTEEAKQSHRRIEHEFNARSDGATRARGQTHADPTTQGGFVSPGFI